MKSVSLCNRYTAAASVICGVLLAAAALACDGDSAKSGSAEVTMMDSDRNGTVSQSEHEAGAQAMFARMDANGDGRVTAAEMDAAHAALHGKQGLESARSGLGTDFETVADRMSASEPPGMDSRPLSSDK